MLIAVGDDGGCEGNPAAFSPRTHLIYYGARYEPAIPHVSSKYRTRCRRIILGFYQLPKSFPA